MGNNLDYELEKTTLKCFVCLEEFSLYKEQQMSNLNSCSDCRNPKLTKLLSYFGAIEIIANFAKTNKIRINDRDAVYLDELIEYFQK